MIYHIDRTHTNEEVDMVKAFLFLLIAGFFMTRIGILLVAVADVLFFMNEFHVSRFTISAGLWLLVANFFAFMRLMMWAEEG